MNKTAIRITLLLAILLALPSFAYAVASFNLTPDPHASTFNLTEEVQFLYDLNVTVNESSIFYSSNAQDLGFTSFRLDNATGVINVTPTNSEVGFYSLQIIAENRTNNFDVVTATVGFNISNSNDRPNITGVSPGVLNQTLAENNSQLFTFNYSDIDLNDAINATWYLNGSIQTTNFTFNYTPSFCAAGFYELILKINDTANANDTVLWNLTINNTNRAPVQNASIQNRSWQEDTNLSNNLTLSLFLSDEDTLECSGANQNNLTYTATGNSSIQVRINQSTTNVTFTVPADFFGVETIIFNVSDGSGFKASNPVVLNVTNVNDAPEFNATNQTPKQNVAFVYDINATDKDNEVQPGINTLTYYDNASFFAINESSGIINFTPGSSEVGLHVINITLNDTITITSRIVLFNITSNAVPRIVPIINQNATEGVFFRLNVSGIDNDDDNMTFASNYSRFSTFTINLTAINFSFLPDNSDVGNQTILVTVTDANGASNTTIFNLSIFNVNLAPNLTFIANRTIRTEKLFVLNVSGFDSDGDTLAFQDNTSLFNIASVNSSTGQISFTPSQAQIGNHTINITVNDSEFIAWQVFHLIIVNNTAPLIPPIANQTTQEDSVFTLYINATDVDSDTLSFYSNATIFNFSTINATTILINFTPRQSDIGQHWINITANDTPLSFFAIFILNVTLLNDTPYFNPPLTNLSATENIFFWFDANASDEENDALNISSNSTLFNISIDGKFNFTPVTSQKGNYSINISVSDGMNTNTSIITLFVFAFNNPPNITGFSPNASNVSVVENSFLDFNITVTDIDNNTLTYIWRLNGSNVSINSNFRYEPDYDAAGFYNLSVFIGDGGNNISNAWNVTVNDSNRKPFFGLINRTSQGDFSAGTQEQVNVTEQSGNITLARSNGINYVASANYTSPVLDLRSATNLSFVSISWKESRPENTTITFFVRSSPDNSTFTNFTGSGTTNYTNPNGTTINATSDRFIQYKAMLETNNSNNTPTIEYTTIQYQISDFYGREDTIYLSYLDLDNFFRDPDGNSLSYNVSTVDSIEVEIDGQGRVSLTPASNFFGTRTVVFTATDGNFNTTSNNVSLVFADVSEPAGSSTSTTSSGGGGGAGAQAARG